MNQDGLSVKRLTEEQSWLQTGALLVLAIVAFSFALSYAGAVLIPFTLALFLNYLVAPIVDFQIIRLKFSKFIAVTLALLFVVLVLFLLSSLLLLVLQNISQGSANVAFYSKFKEKVEVPLSYVFELVESIAGNDGEEAESNIVPRPDLPDPPPFIKEDELSDPMASVESPEQVDPVVAAALDLPDGEPSDDSLGENDDSDEPVPVSPDDSSDGDAPSEPIGITATDEEFTETDSLVEEEKPVWAFPLTPDKPSEKQIDRTRQFMDWFLYEMQREAPELLRYFGGTLLNLLSSMVLTSIFVGFMLAGRNPYKVSKGIYAEIDGKVRRYITTKFFISAITGVLVWLVLEIIGLRFASMFGLMAFCLNFIPSVGSIVSTILPIPIAFVEFDSWFWIALVILVPGAIQMVIGNVIEPKVMGDGLQLHPVTILLGLTFFALLWGPVGMLLAAPITATFRIVMMRFHTTEPIGNLMAGILPEEADEHDAGGPVPAP